MVKTPWIVSMMIFSASAGAAECPELSGIYVRPQDKYVMEFSLKQTGCESLDTSLTLIPKDGSKPIKNEAHIVPDGIPRSEPNTGQSAAYRFTATTLEATGTTVVTKDGDTTVLMSFRSVIQHDASGGLSVATQYRDESGAVAGEETTVYTRKPAP